MNTHAFNGIPMGVFCNEFHHMCEANSCEHEPSEPCVTFSLMEELHLNFQLFTQYIYI